VSELRTAPRTGVVRTVTAPALSSEVVKLATVIEQPRRGRRSRLLEAPATTRRAVVDRQISSRTARLRASPEAEEAGKDNVAVLMEPGVAFTVGITATWALNRMVVPLSHTNPVPDLAFAVANCGAGTLLCTPSTLRLAKQVLFAAARSHQCRVIVVDTTTARRRITADVPARDLHVDHKLLAQYSVLDARRSLARRAAHLRTGTAIHNLPISHQHASMDALMIYTSGTTGRPKGVVHSFAAVENQVNVLRQAWKWSDTDRIANVLPVHHVHGLVNVAMCALASRAHVTFAYPFDVDYVERAIRRNDINVFMAVPPAYAKLSKHLAHLPEAEREAFSAAAASKVRLFVSGSSALPVSVRKDVESLLGGSVLLERYGMTEIGMALSQPYPVPRGYPDGSVGVALPTVSCRIVDTEGRDVEAVRTDSGLLERSGELWISSPSVFDRYWNRASATAESFAANLDSTRWFKTGDAVIATAPADVHAGEVDRWCYRISGRLSADILKISGYKVSALEIEAVLLDSGLIDEIAVFAAIKSGPTAALSDEAVAVFVPKKGGQHGRAAEDQVAQYAKENLPKYKLPRIFVALSQEIPRNAMGKVNKKDLAKLHASGKLEC
jgi:malonyl-CoA/methylmalonyl-CoA synthetase